jgi:hypothetical protein
MSDDNAGDAERARGISPIRKIIDEIGKAEAVWQ